MEKGKEKRKLFGERKGEEKTLRRNNGEEEKTLRRGKRRKEIPKKEEKERITPPPQLLSHYRSRPRPKFLTYFVGLLRLLVGSQLLHLLCRSLALLPCVLLFLHLLPARSAVVSFTLTIFLAEALFLSPKSILFLFLA